MRQKVEQRHDSVAAKARTALCPPVIRRGAILAVLGGIFFGVYAQMMTPGQFAVSDGAATYSIPIQLPAGGSGPRPGLALNYSSLSGNGPLGVGWNMAGLSSITRCPRTLAQDGVRGAVDHDLTDRYCLNGQRLLAVSGVDGGHATEYRTERESFAKVISYVESGVQKGPGYFIVKTPDGVTMEYGRTADSKIELYGKAEFVVDEWLLNKVYDSQNNYYTVTYQKNSAGALGGYVPLAMEWGGNTSVGVPHSHSVRFGYELRQDKIVGYRAGSPQQTNSRLTEIAVYAGSTLTTRYGLSYSNGGTPSRSFLTQVQECNSAGACKPPVQATYPSVSSPTFGFGSPTWSVENIQPTHMYYWSGDFNGDGLADFASTQTGGAVNVKISTGTGFRSEPPWPVDATWGQASMTWAADFNGDGKTDIASMVGSSVYMKLSVPGGNAFSSATWTINPVPAPNPAATWVGDFDGDGKSDIAMGNGGNVYVLLSTGSGFTNHVWPVAPNWSSLMWTGDFNGDGRTDIAAAQGSSVFMKLSTGAGFRSETWPVQNSWGAQGFFWVADFNGDGLSDIASGQGTSVFMKLSTGTGFVNEIWSVDNLWGAAEMTRVGDFNGDGLADLASASGSSLFFKLSTGSGMRSITVPVASAWSHSHLTWVGDFDGDGRSDFASWGGGSAYMKLASDVSSDLADFFVNGSQTARPVYGNLARLTGSSYLQTGSPTFPVVAQGSTMPVVTSAFVSNGVGGESVTNYTYGNLRAELGPAGRGSLGFEWTQSQNMQTGSVKRTYYRQDWPYLGLVKELGTGTGVGPADSNWKNLTHTVNTSFTCRAATGSGGWTTCGTPSPNTRYFIYPNQIDARAWDYTGMTASDGVFIALPRNRTQQTLNDYGEATWLRTETLNPDGSASGYSKTTTNTYAPVDPVKWHLNRLIRSSVEATSP